MVTVTWADFKNFVDTRKVSIQWIETVNSYVLRAMDGPFILGVTLDKDIPTPDPSDQKDFEDNYKANSNKGVVQKMSQTLGEDSFGLEGVGYHMTATKNSTTTHDLLLTKAYALKGGVAYFGPGCTEKDYMKCQIIDIDNILGFGNNVVLDEYISKWYVHPLMAMVAEDVSIATLPAPGLYFRTIYTSDASATEDASLSINLKTYEVS